MASKTKIQTGFIAKQAEESSKRGTNRGVILLIAVVAVGALLFGGWKAVEMLLNFQNYTNIRNVSLQLNAPQVKEGKAFVDVTLHNANAYPISEPVFKFDLADAGGKEVLRGEIKIDGTIPAADQRTFAQVELGTTDGAPAKMHSDLVRVDATTPKELPSGFSSHFSSAMISEDVEKGLEALTKEAPNYAPLKIALGLQAEKASNFKKAEELYKEAVELDSENANAHYHLALTLMRDGKQKKAMQHLEEAARIDPKDPAVKLMIERIKGGDKSLASD